MRAMRSRSVTLSTYVVRGTPGDILTFLAIVGITPANAEVTVNGQKSERRPPGGEDH